MKQGKEQAFEYRTRVSFVWNYEQDEEWLSSLSEQGLHMDRPGIFRSRFVKDPSVRYVYKADYQSYLNKGDFNQYIGLFEDAGWEYVGSCVGWHYFRKLDPRKGPMRYTQTVLNS